MGEEGLMTGRGDKGLLEPQCDLLLNQELLTSGPLGDNTKNSPIKQLI